MPFDKLEKNIELGLKFDRLEETIEKYSKQCINKNNEVIKNEVCDKMLLYLQKEMLPKIKQ
tara:strand:+ start:5567 stop:5749 length:183 start_codon:yes stop_codon:yes gene_type:complete